MVRPLAALLALLKKRERLTCPQVPAPISIARLGRSAHPWHRRRKRAARCRRRIRRQVAIVRLPAVPPPQGPDQISARRNLATVARHAQPTLPSIPPHIADMLPQPASPSISPPSPTSSPPTTQPSTSPKPTSSATPNSPLHVRCTPPPLRAAPLACPHASRSSTKSPKTRRTAKAPPAPASRLLPRGPRPQGPSSSLHPIQHPTLHKRSIPTPPSTRTLPLTWPALLATPTRLPRHRSMLLLTHMLC